MGRTSPVTLPESSEDQSLKWSPEPSVKGILGTVNITCFESQCQCVCACVCVCVCVCVCFISQHAEWLFLLASAQCWDADGGGSEGTAPPRGPGVQVR